MDTLLKEFGLCSQAGCEASITSGADGEPVVSVRHFASNVLRSASVARAGISPDRIALAVQRLRLETLQVVATR